MKKRFSTTTLILALLFLHLSCESDEVEKALFGQAALLKAIDDSAPEVAECSTICCPRTQSPTVKLSASELDYIISAANAGVYYDPVRRASVALTVTLTNNSGSDLNDLTVSIVEVIDASSQVVGSFYPFFDVSADCSSALEGVYSWESINLDIGCTLNAKVGTAYGCDNNDLSAIEAGETYRLRYRFQNATYYSDYYLTDVTF